MFPPILPSSFPSLLFNAVSSKPARQNGAAVVVRGQNGIQRVAAVGTEFLQDAQKILRLDRRTVGDPPVPAVGAGLDMPAQRGGAAVLDRRHDLELLQAQMPGMGSPISWPGGTQDIGDLE